MMDKLYVETSIVSYATAWPSRDITIAGPNDRYVNDKQICEAVARYLARIGLNVTLDVKPKSIFFDELSSNKHHFYLIGWMDGSYDFGRSAQLLLHTVDPDKGMGVYNGAMYSDQKLDEMIKAKAEKAAKPKESKKKKKQQEEETVAESKRQQKKKKKKEKKSKD